MQKKNMRKKLINLFSVIFKGKAIMNHQCVKITWQDHFSDSNWLDVDEIKEWIKKDVLKNCTTVGVISYEDDLVIVVSASDDGRGDFGENMVIFKKCIIKRETLST